MPDGVCVRRLTLSARAPMAALAVVTGMLAGIAPAGALASQARPLSAPSPRKLAAIGADVNKDVVLFGGVGVWPTVFDDTWTWDGTSWTEIQGLTIHPS